MPNRSFKFCSWNGCDELVTGSYCAEHQKMYEVKQADRKKQFDRKRESAGDRGYNSRWQKYSKAFLRKPENVICKLHLPGCTLLSSCVDHIDPPDGSHDPRFWDQKNHQGACIHCNSVKGRKNIKGSYNMMKNM